MKKEFFVTLGVICLRLVSLAQAQESVCASVKLEIRQEVTFERQGFEATMKLSNPTAANLTNLAVEVTFQDAEGNAVVATSEPDNLDALFFIKLSSHDEFPTNITAGNSQTLRWLIVPSFAAGGETILGEEYQVGANLSYALGGVPSDIAVSPDTIQVKPMPLLSLDYFLPRDVFGDDPFTSFKEEPIPFSLGIRVKNAGFGTAANLQIESGQPEIVENEQGLLVDFSITGSEVNGEPASESLTANFGDVAPQSASVARWLMVSSLDGLFRDFSASFTHDDELGGELTSLIEEVNTHELISDVLVNLPGRDSIRDFLAREEDESIRVYESDNVDFPVEDLSDQASASGTASQIVLAISLAGLPPADGSPIFAYAEADDPTGGRAIFTSLTRSDGKIMPVTNAWTSQRFNKDLDQREYFVHVFDPDYVDGSTYFFGLDETSMQNSPPVLGSLNSQIIVTGQDFSQVIIGEDQDADRLSITSGNLPFGASLSRIDGQEAALTWTPLASQTGSYSINITASDGIAEDTQTLNLIVVDGDSLLSGWQQAYWGESIDPLIIGLDADPDGDSLNNLYEFVTGTNPNDPSSQRGLELEVDGQEKRLSFFRRKGLADDYNFLIFAASDLRRPSVMRSPWQWLAISENDAVVEESTSDGALESVVLTHRTELEREFYRLEISGAERYSYASYNEYADSVVLEAGIPIPELIDTRRNTDTDSDGMSNLMEYARGSNLILTGDTDQEAITQLSSGEWAFSFLRRKETPDARLDLFESETLAPDSWNLLDLTQEGVRAVPLFGNLFAERVVVPLSAETKSKSFYRLEAKPE